MSFSHPAKSKSTATVIYDLDNNLVSNDELAHADKAIAEVIAADVKAFDNQLSNSQTQKEKSKAPLRTHLTPIPKLFSGEQNPASLDTTGTTVIPAELRSITLDCLGGDVAAETAEEPNYPYTNNAKPFNFFNQTDLPVTALLRHVARGELKKAKSMLEKNPALVLYKGQVIDYSGRTIEGTAYQIALGAEDVNTGKDKKGNDKNDGMAEMIRGYFKRAYPNDEKAANEESIKQFKIQFPEKEFPEYYETDEKIREKLIAAKNASDPDIEKLEAVTNAILTADAKEIKRTPMGTKDKYGYNEDNLEVTGDCANAIQAFRDYLKPQGVIKKGKHFNAQLLVKAFEKYFGDQYTTFGTWDSPKNLLFWRQIIGYIERYLPACSAQAFCQGLYNVTDDGQSLKRDLKLDGGHAFFPQDLAARGDLGFDHSIYSYCDARVGGRVRSSVGVDTGFVAFYKAYVKQKQQSFERAYAAMSQQSFKEGLVRNSVTGCHNNNP